MELASTDVNLESFEDELFAETSPPTPPGHVLPQICADTPAGVSWISGGIRPVWACKTLRELTCQEVSQALTLLASRRPADEVLARVLADRLGAPATQSTAGSGSGDP